jgi:DNA primase
LDGDHPRLLIPFRDEQGEIFAYQGRAFGNEQPKYITIKLKDEDKIFGLDRVTKDKHIYVVEGPLDSLFLDNCIAVAGATFGKPLMIEGRLIENDQLTIIFDNEPRNKEICKQIEKTIATGRNVCLWPEHNSHKDINDMIVAGYTKHDIENQIKQFTFSGATAKLRFTAWRKTNE